MGLEPTRVYAHKILSLACLPIPALPHLYSFRRCSRIDSYIIPPGIGYCKHFFKKIYSSFSFRNAACISRKVSAEMQGIFSAPP